MTLAPHDDSARPTPDDEDGRPLQDLMPFTCYGCGAQNPLGLQIKSFRQGDALVCRWQPRPEHIGPPGHVYGGIIASVVDCHALWAAIARRCRDEGHSLSRQGPPDYTCVTGRLTVNYRKPAAIDRALELRAWVTETGERKSVVACEVRQGELLVATAEVVAVKVPAGPAPPG